MSRTEMVNTLEHINCCNRINDKIKLAKKVISESSFLQEEKISIQFTGDDLDEMNGLQLFLAYKLGKGDEKKVFEDADCDVSLLMIIVYCKLLGIDPNEQTIEYQKSFNKRFYKFEIIQPGKPSYRGDTLTSIQYVLKKHIALLWKMMGENSKFISNEDYKKFYELFSGVSNRGLLCSDYGSWDDIYYNNAKLIWNVLDDGIKQFLSVAWTLGNFIPMPVYINPSRNDRSGTKDTTDVLLWNIYVFYQLFSHNEMDLLEKHLKNVLSGNYKEAAIVNYKEWLLNFGNWDSFIKRNCLQDFVKNDGIGKYGRPYSLKTGKIIEIDLDGVYISVPETYEESKKFFYNLNDKILKRGERIIQIINS